MARGPRLVEESVVRIEGPWQHRQVSANGIDLHLVEAGRGPLVILLHGFPQFWWTWRHQLTALAGADRRAVAVDLRGYGASDKPPRGYDSMTLAADVVGLIRSLGETAADVVGHGWGGHLAWTLGAMHPQHVRRLVAVSAPHPSRWPRAITTDRRQRAATHHVLRFQLPWHPERWLVADDATNVTGLLRHWGGPGYPVTDVERAYRDAMLIRSVPHCSMECYRWAVRSIPRSDGRRFRAVMRQPIPADVLQLQGGRDPYVLSRTAQGSDRWVTGRYEFIEYDEVGHFPQEEQPDRISGDIVAWLSA